MTLTVGGAPLANRTTGETNYTLDSPPHRLLFEPYPLRLRAIVGGRVVLDSTRACLLHETGLQVVPYVPLDDLDASALERTDTTTHCPFKGDASYWTVGGAQDALWAYEDPLEAAAWLRGFAALKWSVPERWLVEDEPAFGPHLRDPYHRVDVWETSRPVEVRAGEHVLARSTRARLLAETSLPVRVYLPLGDVAPGVLEESATRTECPYKGEARYWSVRGGDTRMEDAAWLYETPLPEALKVAGHVCFDADGIDITVGEAG